MGYIHFQEKYFQVYLTKLLESYYAMTFPSRNWSTNDHGNMPRQPNFKMLLVCFEFTYFQSRFWLFSKKNLGFLKQMYSSKSYEFLLLVRVLNSYFS